MTYNRLLTDIDRENYKVLIEDMFETVPEMMSRKIARANVQQAFMVETILNELLTPAATILCVGSFEDTASSYLKKKHGYNIVDIDPQINTDLHYYVYHYADKFDVVFSTSVIEHVPNDESFIEDICLSLKPGGLAILTCDYNNDYQKGDILPYSDVRFYTENDLKFRLGKIIAKFDCALVDCPDWSGKRDFIHDGCNYSFATYTFRKDK